MVFPQRCICTWTKKKCWCTDFTRKFFSFVCVCMSVFKLKISENVDLKTWRENASTSVFQFWIIENINPNCEEIIFTGVFLSCSSSTYEFRENDNQLNFTRKRNCLVGCPHVDPHTLRKNLFFLCYVFECVFQVSKLFVPETFVICEWIKIELSLKNKNRKFIYYLEL